MRTTLKSVLELLEQDTQEQLVYHFLALNQHRPHVEALLVGMLNAAEERMECCISISGKKTDIQRYDVEMQDLSHPLIHALRSGTDAQWSTLHRGTRLEDARFGQFVYQLPSECGLYVTPLFGHNASACGVIAVFACQVERYTQYDRVFRLSSELFQHRLKKIQELEQLRRQLRQIREVFHNQQQRQKELDELMVELSSMMPKHPQGTVRDYSDIRDLTSAIEEFECEVITQRLRLYGADRKRAATSLNLSPRALSYKLTKYRNAS